MTILFDQGTFESGDWTGWTSGLERNSGTADVVTIMPFKGVYHGRFTTLGVASWERGACRAALGNPLSAVNVYARGYFRIVSHPAGSLWFLTMREVGDLRVVQAGVDASGYWCLRTYNGAGYATVHSTVLAPIGQYVSVELHMYRAVNGRARLFVNGTVVAEATGRDLSNLGKQFDVIVGAETTSGAPYAYEVYVDDVVAADAYIGPEVTGHQVIIGSIPLQAVAFKVAKL